ncbi:MAG: signal peptidase I [Ruminococcaceae bacterium]|nr:signal peptidase I [Oscillospiraceae bacterium]
MLKKLKIVFGIVLIVCVLVSLVYVVVMKTTDKAPLIFGMSMYRTPYEDMEPEISAGEVVIIKEYAPEDIKYGDVVIYKDVRKNDFIIQQVSKEPYEKDGVYYFTTRGLRPNSVDSIEFSEYELRGKVIYKVPFLGTVYDFLTAWYGMLALVIVLFIIYHKDIVSLIKKFRMRHQPEDIDGKHNNIEDFRQSQSIEGAREQEFGDIILGLDDTEE